MSCGHDPANSAPDLSDEEEDGGYIPPKKGGGHSFNRNDFQIFVRNLDGHTMTFWVRGSETVYDLKRKIQEKKGMPPVQQRLQFQGKDLKDSNTMEESHIHKESTIELMGRLRGG